MRVRLRYGTAGLDVDLPSPQVTVFRHQPPPALADERRAFLDAIRRPLGTPPLADLVKPGERVAIVIPDVTRPFPGARLLPWLLAALPALAPERVVIISGTGSHRPHTPAERECLVGADVLRRYRCLDHHAADRDTMVRAGVAADGHEVWLNREYVEADRRLLLGFIEPHFLAGFSGGWKAVCPGLVDSATIMRFHGPALIGDPRSAWGELDGNPTQAAARAYAALVPADFLINVTLDAERRIAAFYCGSVDAAHRAGCAAVRARAFASCPAPFPIVIGTNNGYPLDQNLYQAVKGLSAASRIVTPGGLVLLAAQCRDGFPAHGHFRDLLFAHTTPEALLAAMAAPGFSVFDQWEAQALALIRRQARVALYSELPPADVRRAWLEPVADIAERVRAELARVGRDAPIAVIPEGFMVLPTLAAPA